MTSKTNYHCISDSIIPKMANMYAYKENSRRDKFEIATGPELCDNVDFSSMVDIIDKKSKKSHHRKPSYLYSYKKVFLC